MSEIGQSGSAYQRAVNDPVFRSRVRDWYSGRHELLDALWWLEHPTDPSPRGTASPAAALASLQRSVFSPSGADPEQNQTAALVSLQRALTADRDSIELALTRADEEQSETPPAENTLRPAPLPQASEPPQPGPSATKTARWMMLGVATASVFVGLAIATLSNLGATAPLGDGPLTTVSSPSPRTADTVPPDALAIFDTPQTADDVPTPGPIDDLFAPETIRDLFRDVPRSLGTTTRAYVARDRQDQVCLILIDEDQQFSATCATENNFARGSLQLSVLTTGVLTPNGTPEPALYTVQWNANGEIERSLGPPTT